MAFQRTERIALEMQRVLSEIIMNDLNDPRIGSICSVIKADLTNDLQHCKVYVTIYGNDEERNSAFEAINKAKGFIRRQLSSKMDIRKTPELHFVLDDSISYSVRISQLIDQINSKKGD